MAEKEILEEIPLKNVEIDDKFWNKRLESNWKVTLDHLYLLLEKSGRIDNFRIAAGGKNGDYNGVFFNDSDVFKWLESACYTLINYPDLQLKERLENLVSLIANAQQEDGYLNTYFIVVEPEKKWTNLGMMSELYCAGHLFQAAVAHFQATEKDDLLKVAVKLADHIDQIFRKNGRNGIPGHEGIEMALIELFRITGKRDYLLLAKYFIDNRGREDSFFKKEIETLNERAGYSFEEEIENYQVMNVEKLYKQFFLDKNGNYSGTYAQDHQPVRKQNKVVGHAVRAMYLYCGMTDLALESGEKELIAALMKLWSNMNEKKIYITGGIGSSHNNEGFVEEYFLPNREAYAEACASVGSIMWNQRMLKMTGEARFADLIERVLYNALLAAVSLTGDKFFYVNPLASTGDHHRKGSFNVLCCPPNISRFLASLQKYIYLISSNEIFINLYISGKVSFFLKSKKAITLEQSSNYPWDGKVKIRVNLEQPEEFGINLRVPDWCKRAILTINGEKTDISGLIEKGYVKLERRWKPGDEIKLKLAMPINRVVSHPAITENIGRIAIQRGPLIYCLEEADNLVPLDQLMIVEQGFSFYYDNSFLNGAVIIEGKCKIPDLNSWQTGLYQNKEMISYKNIKFKAIPYYLWDHRQPGEMIVWVREAK